MEYFFNTFPSSSSPSHIKEKFSISFFEENVDIVITVAIPTWIGFTESSQIIGQDGTTVEDPQRGNFCMYLTHTWGAGAKAQQ